MSLEFRIEADNSAEVIAECERQCQAALEAIGNQAVSHAKNNITEAGRVDTGALRNSISHQIQDMDCYVGTNIEYAIYHEYGTGIYTDGGGGRQTPWYYVDAKGEGHFTHGMKPIHFLKNAIADHLDEYRQIVTQFLKGNSE